MEYQTTNIDMFNRSVGLIWAKLYENFPKRIDLDFNNIAIEMFDGEDNDKSYEEKHLIFSATVSWLDQAGYIWANKIEHYEAYGVVLSPKGLETLKLIPEKYSDKNIGQQLSDLAKTGTKEAAKNLISGLVSLALTEGCKFIAGKI